MRYYGWSKKERKEKGRGDERRPILWRMNLWCGVFPKYRWDFYVIHVFEITSKKFSISSFLGVINFLKVLNIISLTNRSNEKRAKKAAKIKNFKKFYTWYNTLAHSSYMATQSLFAPSDFGSIFWRYSAITWKYNI